MADSEASECLANQRITLSCRQKTMDMGNLFDGIPTELPEELFTTILQANGFRIERIVSHGHSSPEEFWYDQDDNEWIMLLEGSAALQFEGDAEPVELRRGSYLNIPAHARHRIVWTEPKQKTVWLAIHYKP